MNKLKNAGVILSVIAGSYFVGSSHEGIGDAIKGRDQYIVVQNPGELRTLSADVKVVKTLENSNGYVVKINDEKAKELKQKGFQVYPDRKYKKFVSGPAPCECEPCVDLCEDDQPTEPTPPPADFKDEITWGMKIIKADLALHEILFENETICIIDTGMDSDHPDLKGIVKAGKSFVYGTTWEDDEGHGTHVASTAAAKINDVGIFGAAQIKLLIAKALNKDGWGNGSDIGEAIDWCRLQKTTVISMSLGSPHSGGADPFIQQKLFQAANEGILFAIAAGNDGQRTGWPAAHDHPNVYAVAALAPPTSQKPNGSLASFSSRGPEIDVIAPGVNIKGAKMGGGYVNWDGTSMATPHVAAVLAMAAVRKKQIKTMDIGLPADHQGKGLVDALATAKQ